MNTYAIHEANIERLRKKVDRIRNKCAKYGCDFHYAEIGEEFRTFNEGEDAEHVERFILVEAEGTAKVNGWRFLATLDHTEGGNIIHKMIGDVEVPEKYYTCEPACDHCNSRRHRKNTYIIYNEDTQEFKQVGSSCLCDFTGGYSAEAAAAYISIFDSLMEFEAAPAGYSSKKYYSVDAILKYAADIVSHVGYVSSQDEWSYTTKERVIDSWNYDNGNIMSEFDKKAVEEYRSKFSPDYDSAALAEYVETVKNHIRSKDADSDYIHNLQVIVDSEYIEGWSLGYAVSAIQCYRRDVEREEAKRAREARNKAERASSEYIGSVKDKVEIIQPKSVEVVSQWDNAYGVTTRYKIVDDAGNVIMWDSSTWIDNEKKVMSIKGTVKKLDEWNGVKQTWLTRCRVAYYA